MAAMACFDSDGDRRFSLLELRAAVGVWDSCGQYWNFLELLHFSELNIYQADGGTGMPPSHPRSRLFYIRMTLALAHFSEHVQKIVILASFIVNIN